MPSTSFAMTVGRSVDNAIRVSRHERLAIEPESSMRRRVSKVLKNAKASSFSVLVLVVDAAGEVIRGTS